MRIRRIAMATPAIGDGKLCMRAEEPLYAFGESGPSGERVIAWTES